MKYGNKLICFYDGKDRYKEISLGRCTSNLPIIPSIGAQVSFRNYEKGGEIEYFKVLDVEIRYETDDILHDSSSFNEVEAITIHMQSLNINVAG